MEDIDGVCLPAVVLSGNIAGKAEAAVAEAAVAEAAVAEAPPTVTVGFNLDD